MLYKLKATYVAPFIIFSTHLNVSCVVMLEIHNVTYKRHLKSIDRVEIKFELFAYHFILTSRFLTSSFALYDFTNFGGGTAVFMLGSSLIMPGGRLA
jgi:hypothetical protein